MGTKVKWSALADKSLKKIHAYIAEDSSYYASKFIIALIQQTDQFLSLQPLSGRVVPELQETPFRYYREVIYKGYRIIYDPSNSPLSISIVTVMNGRQSLKGIDEDWIID